LLQRQTASGIFIPDTAKENHKKGTVVAVGNGTKEHTMTVKIMILFFTENMLVLN
jgi:chaperonin GroES